MKPYLVLFILISAAMFAGCTKIISMRTDEDAWVDYQKDLKSKRSLASGEPQLLASFGNFESRLEMIPVRRLLLSCRSSASISSCYQSKLTVAFDDVYRKAQRDVPALKDQIYKRIQKDFLFSRSFEKVDAEVQSFHQILLSGMDLQAVEHIRDLHQKCESTDESGVIVQQFEPFVAGNTEMPKSYYACLNREWAEDENALLQETAERLGISFTTQEAQDWIREKQIRPVYFQVSESILARKHKEERQRFKDEFEVWQSRLEKGETLSQFIKRVAPSMRERYHYLSVEGALTELFRSRDKSRTPAGRKQ